MPYGQKNKTPGRQLVMPVGVYRGFTSTISSSDVGWPLAGVNLAYLMHYLNLDVIYCRMFSFISGAGIRRGTARLLVRLYYPLNVS